MSLILAADLGKFNSVLCWFEPDSRRTEFRTVRSSAAELRAELLRQPVAQVVFEACSQAGWVHDGPGASLFRLRDPGFTGEGTARRNNAVRGRGPVRNRFDHRRWRSVKKNAK